MLATGKKNVWQGEWRGTFQRKKINDWSEPMHWNETIWHNSVFTERQAAQKRRRKKFLSLSQYCFGVVLAKCSCSECEHKNRMGMCSEANFCANSVLNCTSLAKKKWTREVFADTKMYEQKIAPSREKKWLRRGAAKRLEDDGLAKKAQFVMYTFWGASNPIASTWAAPFSTKVSVPAWYFVKPS